MKVNKINNYISNDIFVNELLDLLAETFEKTQGIFLDKSNSLFDTLSGISAAEASQQISPFNSTIAAQVEHIRYYLNILASDIQNRQIDKIDWDQSWSTRTVTEEKWRDLQDQLLEEYRQFTSDVKKVKHWKGEDDIGAALAILSHTAYHLGAIRQMIHFLNK